MGAAVGRLDASDAADAGRGLGRRRVRVCCAPGAAAVAAAGAVCGVGPRALRYVASVYDSKWTESQKHLPVQYTWSCLSPAPHTLSKLPGCCRHGRSTGVWPCGCEGCTAVCLDLCSQGCSIVEAGRCCHSRLQMHVCSRQVTAVARAAARAPPMARRRARMPRSRPGPRTPSAGAAAPSCPRPAAALATRRRRRPML